MLPGKKILRITAAVVVAAAAAHTAERLRAPAVEQSLLISAAQLASDDRRAKPLGDPAVPKSASLSGTGETGLGELISITSVAASTPAAGSDRCRPDLQLDASPGAMIRVALVAPCNRGERVVLRHAGLSFTAKLQADGLATILLPALKSDAMVAAYLQDSRVLLGKVTVPDAAAYARYAIVWEPPAELELRVTDGDKVLVGSTATAVGDAQRVIALGVSSVPSPVLARVYSVPGHDLGRADITGELRITADSCGRTLRLETVHSVAGVATPAERSITVPLCGTAGDILVLKNLVPGPKLAIPK